MVESFSQDPGVWPYLRCPLGSSQFRDRRIAARFTGRATAAVATHAALRIRSGSFIQSHQLRTIRYRHLSVVDVGRALNFLST